MILLRAQLLQAVVFMSRRKIQWPIPGEDSEGEENSRDHHNTRSEKEESTGSGPLCLLLFSESPEGIQNTGHGLEEALLVEGEETFQDQHLQCFP